MSAIQNMTNFIKEKEVESKNLGIHGERAYEYAWYAIDEATYSQWPSAAKFVYLAIKEELKINKSPIIWINLPVLLHKCMIESI